MTQDELDAWCGGASNLKRSSDGHWGATDIGQMSFPDEAHTDLAAIEDHSYWFAHRNAVIASIVGRHPPAGTIFDIGGGNGFVSHGLMQAGHDAVVVEPGAAGVAVARGRGLKAIQASFETLEPPPASITAVGLFDVLEHIEDSGAALAGIARSLVSGGILYVAVPAYGFLWSAQDDYGGHFRRYTLGTLGRELKRAGFETLFGTYFFSALVLPLLVFRTLPSVLGWRHTENAARSGADEHGLPKGPVGRLMRRSFEWEMHRIEASRHVPFGTSCIIAARKSAGP